jgi:hypothetical protein
MQNKAQGMGRANTIRWFAATLLGIGAFAALPAQAQMPARFYWKSLSGANGVPVLVESLSGNTNPADPSHAVTANGSFDGTLALAGYAHTFTLFDRSAMAAFIAPMGRLSGRINTAAGVLEQSSNGFGDPTFEFNLNLIGPKAQRTIPDAMRFEPGFSLDLVADIMVPIGKYNADQQLNIGQNRWYGRVGLPIVWQLGPWIPGRRTTLEVLPAVWLFGDNNDFVGQTLSTDPMFQVDAHLTRDLTPSLWAAIDASYYTGGRATIGGIAGDKLNNFGIGATLGYEVNHNLNLTFGYKTTVNDSDPGDLRMDRFMFTLVYGWHPTIEGARRLQNAE